MVSFGYQYLIAVLFLGWAAAASCQNPLVLESQSLARKATDRTHSLLHYDSLYYYVFRVDNKFEHTELEIYNKKMELQRIASVSGYDHRHFGAMNLLGNLYLLRMSYVYNREEDQYENVCMRAYPMDKDSFNIGHDSVTLVAPFTMKSNYYRGDFAISPDKSKILVYEYEEIGDIEGVTALTNSVKLSVYDINFNLLWKRSIDLAPEGTLNRLVSLKKLRLSNEGKVGILTDIFKSAENRTYSGKTVTTSPTLFFVGEATNDFMRFTPNLGELFYNQMDFTFDNTGDIIWFGCYSAKRYYQQAGLFYIKVNKERSKVLAKKQIPFSDELIAKTLDKKTSAGRELRNFVLSAWRLMPDQSGVVLSLENRPPSNFNFKAHETLTVSLSKEGELRWASPTRKWGSVAEQNGVFLSHYLSVVGADVYLIYNNGINNENQAIVSKIDSQGQRSDKLLFRYDRQENLLCPRLSYPIPDGKLFICLQSRFFNNYNFGILDLPAFFAQKS